MIQDLSSRETNTYNEVINQINNLDSLSCELVLKILSFLPLSKLASTKLVNHNFLNLSSDKSLWLPHLKIDCLQSTYEKVQYLCTMKKNDDVQEDMPVINLQQYYLMGISIKKTYILDMTNKFIQDQIRYGRFKA